MRKGAYFGIQALWSLVLSSIVWYCFLKNAHFDFYHNSDDTLAGIILVVGAAVYLVLTIVYMVLGHKKVKNWSAWMIAVSLVVSVAVGLLGSFVVIYGSEWIHKLISA